MDVDSNHAPRINRDLLDTISNKKDDIQHLTRVWQNERHAPDILPVAAELLSRILDLIRRQMSAVNTLRSADVTMSEEDHYRTTLVQTEAERVKFVIRSYVRTRLSKIEQYSAYITLHKEIHPRLTESELRHAQRYGELVVSQFNTTVLGHLPEPQRYLDDDTTGAVPSMIPEPDKSKPVFFHAFDAIEGIQLDDGTTVAISKDTIMLVPYRVIEQNLLRDEGELV
ncbi:GINS complex, Sld5 component [Fomitiporia mediterranea MF3/22]|uniref:GINS complex, Sld5 component n=1 Tax=Fomitiporia mediterranea (strain MF3/22) TaxID=694068 RepID=UPI0004407EC9|nr:GINS complex, Sld5 component [Fomitiporia mediterranea MF3/22]EJD00344.1 GINS complex, Sld5 component [Fomitiporia mediterranea MF3/22]